jgi:enoyl-CoA hydratase
MDEARRRDDVGAVLLTGAGRAFVAGADIGELVAQSAVEGKARAERGQRTFRKFETSPKPTVAAINGFALGGGCELAMACHIRIASEAAKFGQPEVKLGIVPGYGGTQRLPRLVGKGRALQLLLTGEMIDAAEAFRIGLVNRVVPAAELLDAARAMLTTMLAQGPLAMAHVIEAVDRGLDMPLDDAIALEAAHFGLLSATADKAEGMSAFLEKRPATFSGK